jgi:hypothetical protein
MVCWRLCEPAAGGWRCCAFALYLHVDFDEHLAAFCYGGCGFRPTGAGLMMLGCEE